ncbi:histidine kinase [Kitasatospora sp. NPDC002227]|uniref:sensor histidine kinase n=1 Tax=Kitasatospora sp. NPDC002227 TaxID=3154773 RepID=UPI0033243784
MDLAASPSAPPLTRRRVQSVWLQDLALSLAITVPDVFFAGNPTAPGTGWATQLQVLGFALLQAVALVLRRRHPLVVFAVVWGLTTAAIALTAAGVVAYTPYFGLLLALYTVAEYCGLPAAFAALALTMVPVALETYHLVAISPSRWLTATVAANLAFMLPLTGAAWGLARWGRAARAAAERDRRELAAARERVVRERTRIARELHDIVANAVAVMVMRAETARTCEGSDPGRTAEAFGHIEELGRAAMAELRRMLRLLRSADPETDETAETEGRRGLGDLQQLLEDVRRAGVAVELEVVGTPARLDASVDLTAYRLVQEAVTNITKHAGPGSHAAVRVTWAERLHLEVTDDGAGHTPAARRDLSTGHGLLGLAERVAVCGGELTAAPYRSGFRVTATLPVSPG